MDKHDYHKLHQHYEDNEGALGKLIESAFLPKLDVNIGEITHDGYSYSYIERVAKDGEMVLSTKNPIKYCNGYHKFSRKDPGNGIAFVITDTTNPNCPIGQ